MKWMEGKKIGRLELCLLLGLETHRTPGQATWMRASGVHLSLNGYQVLEPKQQKIPTFKTQQAAYCVGLCGYKEASVRERQSVPKDKRQPSIQDIVSTGCRARTWDWPCGHRYSSQIRHDKRNMLIHHHTTSYGLAWLFLGLEKKEGLQQTMAELSSPRVDGQAKKS